MNYLINTAMHLINLIYFVDGTWSRFLINFQLHWWSDEQYVYNL